MSQFINSVNQVRKNYKKYDAWEQDQADERAQKEYLAENLKIEPDKLELTKNKAKVVIRATEILDKRSEDNCENVEQLTGIAATVGSTAAVMSLPHLVQKYYHKKITSLKEQQSDLQRKILENISQEEKNSISSQIEEIAQKVKGLSKKNYIHSNIIMVAGAILTGAFFALWGTSKQKEASRIGRFQAKQNELKDLSNFVIYTPEQIKKAEEIAANIPDEKEKNSFMETISQIKELSKDKEAYKDWLKNAKKDDIENLKKLNFSKEQLQAGKEDKELIVDAVKEINIKAEEYSENLENSYDTLGTLNWLVALPFGLAINKVLKAFKVAPKINKYVSFAVPIVTGIGVGIMGTLEQKKASRVGRYVARQDLMKNPARLMAFSDEDMAKAKDIKAKDTKKGFFEKIGDSFAFLMSYHKDKKAYEKYRKEEQKQAEKLQKAFKQVEITEEQKQAAEGLKKNVYKAFDEIDELSQRYSEDVEAACDISKQAFSQVWTIGALVGTVLGGKAVSDGKFPIAKIVNGIVNVGFKKDAPLRQNINEIYSLLKKDKKLMQEFQRSLVRGNISSFLAKPESKEIAALVAKLEISMMGPLGKMLAKRDDKVFWEELKPQMKDGKIAVWSRNMVEQGTKLYARNKIGDKLPKEIVEQMNLKGWKNYKTLIKTAGVVALPALAVIFAVPYAVNAWFTNIQKKAGKIGIMEAMDKIDDDRVFAPEKIVAAKNIATTSAKPQTNLLQQYKQANV